MPSAESLDTRLAREGERLLPQRQIYTISRLNNEVRAVLEANFPPLWVQGEISNLARPRSGHLYFSLKDEDSQVRCAMFRTHNRLLSFTPQSGVHVLVRAQVSLYPERGDFQLLVEYMEEAGDGALRRAFEALKQRLATEGLFDQANKKTLPAIPVRLGVITSPTGAAVRDILSVLKRRFPAVPVLVYPVPVQGPCAAEEIARMLALANERMECDALILARGGGSLEDLWAFNEELVARALHTSKLPVVTGIGHEIDFTIADFVADERAATPSAAAELVTPDQVEWRQRFRDLEERLLRRMRGRLHDMRQALAWREKRLTDPRRRLLDKTQRTDELLLRLTRACRTLSLTRRAHLTELAARLYRRDPLLMLQARAARRRDLSRRLIDAGNRFLGERRTRLDGARRALETVSPLNTLERGYAILTRYRGGQVIHSATTVHAGERLNARLARGTLVCTVDKVSDN